MLRRVATILVLVSFSEAFLFPSAGGGGGGCGCGQDTSCLPQPPKLSCQKFCFSIPTLSLPMPQSCGCGGRKKREANGDEKCATPELKSLIDESIGSTVSESRNNVLKSLETKFPSTRYLVTCVEGSHEFTTSADDYCSSGTEQQSCLVAKAVENQ